MSLEDHFPEVPINQAICFARSQEQRPEYAYHSEQCFPLIPPHELHPQYWLDYLRTIGGCSVQRLQRQLIDKKTISFRMDPYEQGALQQVFSSVASGNRDTPQSTLGDDLHLYQQGIYTYWVCLQFDLQSVCLCR